MTPNGYECFECGHVEETGEDWLGDGTCAWCEADTIGPVVVEPCPNNEDPNCQSDNHDFEYGDHVTAVSR